MCNSASMTLAQAVIVQNEISVIAANQGVPLSVVKKPRRFLNDRIFPLS